MKNRSFANLQALHQAIQSNTDDVAVLFSGESGTGKTMAGIKLASTLKQHFFKVNISTVVSKYIGETEKNLNKTFKAAEMGNAVLFFDEADALFGKRTDIKDAHDRYANVRVDYLLNRLESYPGLVVLATNKRENLDKAFLKVTRHVLEFPLQESDCDKPDPISPLVGSYRRPD